MARQVINVGTVANDGTGDTIRAAFQKANANFLQAMPLEANLNLYVDPTGSDSNDGLTLASPFLTIQKAVSTAARYVPNVDTSTASFTVTVNVADGTYSSASPVSFPAGVSRAARLQLVGNAASPANVIIRNSGALATVAEINGVWSLNGVQLEYTGATASTVLCRVQTGGDASLQNIVFGTNVATGYNVGVYFRGYCNISGTTTDIGGGRTIAAFAIVEAGGYLGWSNVTCACGTLTVSGNFVQCLNTSQIRSVGMTFTGTVTGSRYLVSLNGVINTFGGGANYFPGNSAGAAATGGQYA